MNAKLKGLTRIMGKRFISTWRFSLESINKNLELLNSNDSSNLDCLENIIKCVENDERVLSVGYSGLPNIKGFIEMDSAMMDGDTLSIGSVGGIRRIKNPICLARRLMSNNHSNFLSGEGAYNEAVSLGLETFDGLLEKPNKLYKEAKIQSHDTIGAICLDETGSIAVGTSTSGLFLKKEGRIGDSPLPGCGYYADSSIGAAAATGMGEDIYKIPVSFLAVQLMENGKTAQEAVDEVIARHESVFKIKNIQSRGFAIIAMKSDGTWGAATNLDHFSFVVYDGNCATTYICKKKNRKTTIEKATPDWINNNIE